MERLLLIDDEPADLRMAAAAAQDCGFTSVDARSSAHGARAYLDSAMAGIGPLPDAIILDLDLGYESGYELLRLWHSTPALKAIPMIVWSVLETQGEICQLFNVTSFVSKWQGASGIQEALSHVAC